MKKSLIYISSILSLVLLGYIFWKNFIEFTFSQLEPNDVPMVSSSMQSQIYGHVLFSLFIGSIPVLLFLVRKLTSFQELKYSFVTIGIIITFGILMWQYRIIQANSQLKLLYSPKNESIKNFAYFDSLSFEIFLFIGFIMGALISLIILKTVDSLKKL